MKFYIWNLKLTIRVTLKGFQYMITWFSPTNHKSRKAYQRATLSKQIMPPSGSSVDGVNLVKIEMVSLESMARLHN